MVGGGLSAWWRSWGPATITVVGVLAATIAPLIYQDAPEGERDWPWMAVAGVGAAVAALTPLWDARARKKRRQSYQDRVKEAREEQVVAINDALDPLVEKVGELVMTEANARPSAIQRLVVQALNSAAQVIGPERTRVNYFEADTSRRPHRLVCKGSAGRHTAPKSEFLRSQPDGKWVFGLLEKDEPYFCESVTERPPPGWDASRRRDYQTFISVPASVRNEAVGMLTADAPEKGDLQEKTFRCSASSAPSSRPA